jgi:hypothetical protein
VKHLFLAFFVSLQAFVATDALARSLMDSDRSTSRMLVQCQWLTAGSEENLEDQNKKETEEEEEEPDCD